MSNGTPLLSGKPRQVLLEPANTERLANLCGQLDEHLRQVEHFFGVEINNRGHDFRVSGSAAAMNATAEALRNLYSATDEELLTPERVHLILHDGSDLDDPAAPLDGDDVVIKTRRGLIRGRGTRQRRYLRDIRTHDLAFGIGPAGTGKTFLAVASAVDALERDEVRRIVLVRPAVEAGERLGFLPGDMVQKVDPYLRPIYDSLYDMLGFDQVARFIERHVIEVAPLAFMRGRSLNDAFVILDEAQNTTVEQMKMFLTRIGFGSRAVVTGDVTQTDLPDRARSGLVHASRILRNVEGVAFVQFDARDVVRHPLVKRIVRAYEAADASAKNA